MRKGDLAFLYHSSCAEPAVTGIMEVCRSAYPDPTQFDRRSAYFDPGSQREDPRWLMVDVRLRRRLGRPVTLAAMRAARGLAGLALLQRGNRLSVMPVTDREWEIILGLE
jgi:predicted RNA-binding protein with PUA-like domain